MLHVCEEAIHLTEQERIAVKQPPLRLCSYSC